MCGKVPPHVSALACAGSESSVTQCPMSTGDDVLLGTMCFARRKNQWHCPAPGLETRLVSLCEHEARVGAAKTANRFISFLGLPGLTHALCIVQTAAVVAWM